MWKGTAAILKPKPTSRRARPAEQHAVVGDDVLGQVVGDLGQVGRPGGAVGEGDPVDEDGRGEGPEHEVLEGGLAGLGPLVVEGGQHVEGDGHDLEAEEDDDEVVGRPHHHGPRRRHHGQDVVLGTLHALPPQVAVPDEGGQQHGDGHGDLDEDGEAVVGDGPGDGDLGPVGRSRGPTGRARPPARRPRSPRPPAVPGPTPRILRNSEDATIRTTAPPIMISMGRMLR